MGGVRAARTCFLLSVNSLWLSRQSGARQGPRAARDCWTAGRRDGGGAPPGGRATVHRFPSPLSRRTRLGWGGGGGAALLPPSSAQWPAHGSRLTLVTERDLWSCRPLPRQFSFCALYCLPLVPTCNGPAFLRGGFGTRPRWLALLACGGAYWPLALEPSAMTSRHPYYCGHPHCRGHPPAPGGGVGNPECTFCLWRPPLTA